MADHSLNFIRLLRVLITPSVRGGNDSKQSDEFQARQTNDLSDFCLESYITAVCKI